jgi:hypothetical protein
MSDTVATQIGAYLGYASMIIMGLGSIIALINRHRIRSSCCGHEASLELNIEATTPPEKKPEIKV